jgi:GAF domain-containing protein
MSDLTAQLQLENDRLHAELAQLRQNYERLQKSEACYRQVVENAPDFLDLLAAQEAFAQDRAQQLEASNRVLQLRENWLEATAAAANVLLSTPGLDQAINKALRLIGEGIAVDRVDVLQHIDDPSDEFGYVQMLYEWYSPYTSSQMNSDWQEIPRGGMETWLLTLKAGNWVGGIIEELPDPFRSNQLELGVQSTYCVPIFVEEAFWSIMSIDCCREPRQLMLPEISVFKTAAACLGSAIQRACIQDEREALIVQERTRMAREIHDTLAQAFGGTLSQLQA